MMDVFRVGVIICLILASAGAASLTKSVLQHEHCTWGAQYWCSSATTAELCGKTEWCAKNDWPHEITQNLQCTVAQQLIKNTRSLIRNSAEKPVSELDFALFVAKGCAVFQDGNARKTCKELATNNDVILKLVKLVGSKLSLQSVATAVGACKKNILKQGPCLRCTDVVSTAQKYVSKFLTEDAYMRLIETQCVKLGQGRQLCQVIGQAKYKDFYNGIINAPVQSLCAETAQCLGTPSNLQAVQVSTECSVCETVVTEIRQLDRSPNVQGAIQNLFKSVCKRLGAFEQLCDNLANEAVEYAFEFIATEMEPNVICEELKMCTSSEQKVAQHPSPLGDVQCTVCEFILKEIDLAIGANVTKEKLTIFLDNICSRLPSPINTECEGFVTQYSSLIIHFLLLKVDPKLVCTALGVCKNGTTATPLIQQQFNTFSKLNDEVCDLCKYVVTYLDTLLTENSTEAEIEASLDKVCSFLPANLSQQCVALVSQFAPVILQYLEQELKPDQVCILIGLCSGNKQENHLSLLLEAASQVKLQLKPVNKQTDVKCELCEYVVTYLDTFLENNSTETEIEALLDKVCTVLPVNYSQQCYALVKEYGPLIVQLLQSELTPENVCTAIGLCTGNKQAASEVKLQPKPVNKQTDLKCEICEYVVTYLDTFLTQNSSETEIEALLDKVCTVLPVNYSQQCYALVKEYGPLIVQLLQSELTPENVCTAIGLCTGNKQENHLSILPAAASQVKLQPKPVNKQTDVKCEICEYVVTYLDTFLTQNSSEAEIEALLDKVCKILPGNYSQQCYALVKEYGPLIVQLLENEFTPDNVCTAIGLCTGNKQGELQVAALVPKIATPTLKIGKQKTEICALCESVMQTLENILKENPTQAEIVSTMDKVCELLPENYKQPCIQLLPMFTSYVVNMLEQKLPPKLICKVVKICVDDEMSVSKSRRPIKKGELCPLCLFVFEEVYNLLEKNSTEVDIEAALDKVCDILPSTIKNECLNFVALYLPYVVDLIIQEVPAEQICQELGLCNATGSPVVLSPVIHMNAVSPVKSGELCTLCIYIFQVLDMILPENATEAKIELALDEVCNYLSTFKDQCTQFIALYTPYVIDLITKEFTPTQICGELGVCTNGTQAKLQVPVNIKKTVSGLECVLCEYIIQYLDKILPENATQQQIEAALDQVCSIIPSTVRQECETFVAQYTPVLVQLLVNFAPAQVCTYLGLCSSQKTAKLQVPVNIKKTVSGPECVLCEYIIEYLDKILPENATQQQIEAALDQVCSIVPSTVTQECETFVAKYTPVLVQLLVNFAPAQVCTYLGLCSSQKTAKLQVPVNIKKTVSGPECVLCEYIIEYLDKILPENATQQQIEAALDQVCSIVPSTVTQECETFVAKYTPVLVQLLVNFAPAQVCTYLGLCSSQKTAKLQVPVNIKKTVSGPECVLCEYIIEYLDKILPENATQQQIEAALDQVCSIVPSTVTQECETFVAKYTPVLVQLLVNFAPAQVCTYLGLCSSQKTAKLQVPVNIKKTVSGPECVLCEYIIEYLDKILPENATQQQIEAALDQVCSIVPSTVTQECETFVAKYTPVLVQLLVNFAPAQVCTYLGLCSSQKTAKLQVPVNIKKTVSGPECVLCEYIIEYLDKILPENATQQQIEAALDQVCSIVPSTVTQECETFVAKYTPVLVQLLVNFAPAQVCTYLGLCSSQKTAKLQVPVNIKKTVSGPECVLCEYIIEYLDKILPENATQQQIEAALDQVCSIVPSTVTQECETFVAKYTPVLVQLLVNFAPAQVCTYLGLCSSQKTAKLQVPVNIKKTVSGPECVLCEYIIEYLDKILPENATQQQIEAALDQVCSIVPSTVTQECETFVAKYTPVLVQLLVNFAPAQVCTYLGLCSSQKTAKLQVPVNIKKTVSGPECVLCEYIIEYLDKILPENATQQQIEAALDQVCSIVPSTVTQECETFVAKYTPVLVQLLVNFAPAQVCTYLGLCSSQKTAKLQVPVNIKKTVSGLECVLCEYIIQYLDKILPENATQQQIEAALDQVCSIMPSTVTQECETFVAKYTPVLVQLLVVFAPAQVCTYLGLCSSQKTAPAKLLTFTSASSAATTPSNNYTYCSACKFALYEVQTALGDPFWQDKTKIILNAMCNYLPNASLCEKLVDANFDNLINAIRGFNFPIEICQDISFCEPPAPAKSLAYTSENSASTTPSNNYSYCSACKFALYDVQTALSYPYWQNKTKIILNAMCNYLPKASLCEKLVDAYFEDVINAIRGFRFPIEVCQDISFCEPPVTMQSSETSCTFCKKLAKMVVPYVQQKKTVDEIDVRAASTCNMISPDAMKHQCVAKVHEYIPMLIQQLSQESDPTTVCETASLCTRPSQRNLYRAVRP